MTTKAEMETIIRWDQEDRVMDLYTTNPADARHWERLGYSVHVFGRTQAGTPRGWRAQGPLEAHRLRRLVGGKLIKRRRGRRFGVSRRKTARAKHHSRRDRTPGTKTI